MCALNCFEPVAAALSRRGVICSALSFTLVSSLSLAAELNLPAAATGTVDYVKDVKPLLDKNCYECHGTRSS